MTTDVDTIAATILSLERAAGERWKKGDVDGPLELYADDVTFFDPITAARLDGRLKQWPNTSGSYGQGRFGLRDSRSSIRRWSLTAI